MKVALVTSGQEILGVEYLSALLKRDGHEVKFFFDPQTFSGGMFLKIELLKEKFDLTDKVVSHVVDYMPDIIGFSCMTHNYQWAVSVAERIKDFRNIPIIFGGIHPTSTPEKVLENQCVDMVAIGEADISFLELLKSMEANPDSTDVKGIFFKKEGRVIKNPPAEITTDLDSLPLPDKDLFYDKVPAFKQGTYSIMTSRGCPFSCTYCCNDIYHKIFGKKILLRRRSVDNVISELQWAKKKFNIWEVAVQDEIFTFDIEWLEEFSEKYKEKIDLPFMANFHFQFVSQKRVNLLKKAGCYKVTFGMQSASEQIRRDVCHRYHSNEKALKAIQLCKKANIKVVCDHILGLPFENESGLAEAVEFYRKAEPDLISTFWLTYFPETSIIEKGKEAGILKDSDMEDILNGRNSYFHKGYFIDDLNQIAGFQFLFDLIPIVNNRLHRWISSRQWVIDLIPKGFFLHFLLVFLANISLNKRPFRRRIAVALSKKYVP